MAGPKRHHPVSWIRESSTMGDAIRILEAFFRQWAPESMRRNRFTGQKAQRLVDSFASFAREQSICCARCDILLTRGGVRRDGCLPFFFFPPLIRSSTP